MIVNTFNRDSLIEGRNYGMGFAFAKKEGDTYNTVQPISPCKDYLNDVLYAEKTGELLPEIYGFEYNKINNIEDTDYYYLVIKICSDYGHINIENRDLLKNNFSNIESFINQIERILNIDTLTKIVPENDNMFVVKTPKFWCKYIYLLSLYTYLLRATQKYDGKIPATDFIKDSSRFYGEDVYMASDIIPRLHKILLGNLPEQPFDKKSSRNIHNSYGIVNSKLDFNTIKV